MSLDVIERDPTEFGFFSGGSGRQQADLRAVHRVSRSSVEDQTDSLVQATRSIGVPSSVWYREGFHTEPHQTEAFVRVTVKSILRKLRASQFRHQTTEDLALRAMLRSPIPQTYGIGGSPSSEHDVLPVFRARVTAPVKTALAVFERWGIDDTLGARVLGSEDRATVQDLKAGSRVLRSRDEKDRVRLLIDIYEGVFALFKNQDVEREWIRTPLEALRSMSVLDLMSEGGFLSLYEAREYIFHLNGRR